ncbi:hypothetical protein [Singulisphaera acidiphila]|uniref:Uncharacterized protein n=1 Tax=Singulisphaera acidiphila (strain ATCC BAA-1392 / DSM 18658 / VKM B-2454 / MOB10) TaxID=886293 RepID=L0DER1_SINAD|nr:hypothetical protein [Singulisphaera acidiphila]AGA27747.1 hypothetical protein Sinac_3490 [Singulisphaera acidiphila DSM 18658]
MRPIVRSLFLTSSLIALRPSFAVAGMPSLLLSDITRMRVQTISFFLLGFLISAWGIQRVWNSLRKDFPRLPRLAYRKAVGVVALWGLLFLLVLTMISGARELMTPGAWQKEGYTYKLQNETKRSISEQESARRQSLDRLRGALWTYAQGHKGRFPADASGPDIPERFWQAPDPSGMRYIYHGGQVADQGATPLAIEPDLFGNGRLLLLTSGEIREMNAQEIQGNTEVRNP